MEGSTLYLDGIRIILSIVMLGYAAFSDVKTREVSDLVWVVFGGVAVLIDGAELFTGALGWEILVVGLAFSTVFSLIVGYLGFFGGADLLAFVAIALLNPVPPIGVFSPILFPSTLFPLTIISNSILVGASTAIGVLILNLTSSGHTGLFEGYQSTGLGTKALLLFTGRKKEVEKVRGPPFEYPLERMNEEGSVSLRLRPDLADDSAALAIFEDLRSHRRKRVWVSYSLPFLLILCIGFVCSIIFGDFALKIVSIFL